VKITHGGGKNGLYRGIWRAKRKGLRRRRGQRPQGTAVEK